MRDAHARSYVDKNYPDTGAHATHASANANDDHAAEPVSPVTPNIKDGESSPREEGVSVRSRDRRRRYPLTRVCRLHITSAASP